MAKETIVTVTDDIDGTPGASTVGFHIDRVGYEIDLSDTNAAKLREVLAPFIAAARRAGSTPTVLRSVGGKASRSTAPRTRDDRAVEKRTFLREAGYQVSDRGRLSREAEIAWGAELTRRENEQAVTELVADVEAETPTEAPEAVTEAVSAPEDTPPAEPTGVRTKVGKLTRANVQALGEVGLLLDGSGATFAILDGTPDQALANVEKVMADMTDKKQTNYASLVAVRMKLRKQESRFVDQIGA